MGLLRDFLNRHRALAAWLLVATLCLKAVVPLGYMPASGTRYFTVSVCADASGGQVSRQIAIPAKADSAQDHARAKGECAYSLLAMALLGGADIALLAAALGFVLALGFTTRPERAAQATPRLRPPSRGPPLAA